MVTTYHEEVPNFLYLSLPVSQEKRHLKLGVKRKQVLKTKYRVYILIYTWACCPCVIVNSWVFPEKPQQEKVEMAVPWSMSFWMAKMVWIALSGWVSSCLTVSDEVASSLRSGDIGPFNVG